MIFFFLHINFNNYIAQFTNCNLCATCTSSVIVSKTALNGQLVTIDYSQCKSTGDIGWVFCRSSNFLLNNKCQYSSGVSCIGRKAVTIPGDINSGVLCSPFSVSQSSIITYGIDPRATSLTFQLYDKNHHQNKQFYLKLPLENKKH